MNRIKGSVMAKIIAWVLLITSGGLFIGSCIMVAVMEDYEIFESPQEDVLERKFAEISDRYSIMALANLKDGDMEENKQYFEDKAFRYGILEAESLEGVNLNSDDIYIDSNFIARTIKKEELHSFSLRVNSETDIWYSEELLGGWGWWTDHTDYQTLYADRICYDTVGGIFYYRADDKYYPVQDVGISMRIQVDETRFKTEYYTFQYDNDRNVYVNMYAANLSTTLDDMLETEVIEESACLSEDELEEWATIEEYGTTTTVVKQQAGEVDEEVEEKWNRTFEQPQVSKGSKEIALLQGKEEITFNIFDGTELDYTKWGLLLFDGIRELDASELTLIDSSMLPKSSFVEVEVAYLDEYYTLHAVPKGDAKDYLVVSYIDESVLERVRNEFLREHEEDGWDGRLELVLSAKNTDLYVLTEVFVDTLYMMKDDIIPFMFGMFLLAVVSFMFLLCAAGHRRKTEGIVPTFMDKIPVDVLGVVVFFIEFFAIGILINMEYSTSLLIQLSIDVGIVLAILLVMTILSFAVRVKMGKWWRNSITYWIFAIVRGLFADAWRNIGVLWKAIIIPTFLGIIEIFFGFCAVGTEAGVVLVAVFSNMLLCMIFFIMALQFQKLQEGSRRIAEGDLQHKIDTSKMFWEFKKHADNLNSISDGMSHAVDERMKSERLKTELITNVSHDIKTPLTSIINYVDLLEKTDIQDETAKEYLEVLERQSARLKKLIEDLIEASKASTGNLSVNMEELEANVFVTQILGEFEEKIANAGLELIINKPEEEIPVQADGRHLWRVVDNLMNNICKYAQPDSRVYINLEQTPDKTMLTFKNMSKYSLNITSEELMERFVRGDSSRNTEGNGLGLSIAKSLMELMNGKLSLYVDGDLFKVVLEFPKVD